MSEINKTSTAVRHKVRLMANKHRTPAAGLRSLMNVGPAMERDLTVLGIRSIPELASAEASDLFHRLERHSQSRVDPCVYDTFCAIIHEAKTGEKTPWYAWTEARKRREQSGELELHASGF